MEIHAAGFRLPLNQLRDWEARRAPSQYSHIDSFEGSPPQPLCQPHNYPGLTQLASETRLSKLDPTQTGDPLQKGLLLSGPLLGLPGAALILLVKDGALNANLVHEGQIKPLPVTDGPSDGLFSKEQRGNMVHFPDGHQIHFRRGTNGANGIHVAAEKDGVKMLVNYWDRSQGQPYLDSVLVEAVNWCGSQKVTQRVIMDARDGTPDSVKITSRTQLPDSPGGGLLKELNSSMALSTRDSGYTTPPSPEEMYFVASNVMSQFDAQKRAG